jgi:hypothetical protein
VPLDLGHYTDAQLPPPSCGASTMPQPSSLWSANAMQR